MNLDSSVLVERRKLGKTGLEVSVLGLGLAQISRAASTKGCISDSATVLNSALDLGINFLDTAACYGDTEQLIGQAVSHRRDEYILATKAGHVVDDTDNLPWTRKTIEESINRSLRLLRTEYVDLLQLHSCSVETLQSGEVIEAVQKIQQTGKARFIGYSGDNEAARWAACSGVFQTLQTSYNVVDQHFKIKNILDIAHATQMGIIIKRPVANSAWWATHEPYPYAGEYFRRTQIMKSSGPFLHSLKDKVLEATGFVLCQPEVSTIITGTHNLAHLQSNVRLINTQLPIPEKTVLEIAQRFKEAEENWRQLM